MKKKIIIFCAALAALSSMSFGFMDGNDSKTDQPETSDRKDLAVNTPATKEINKRTFSEYRYVHGPSPLEKSRCIAFLAVDPEKQAEYEGGRDALMEYLKENSKEARGSMQMDELQSFKLVFTVTKKGTIANAKLDGLSGYLAINNAMIEIITKTSGKWKPAENSKGEKVDQEQLVTFGPTGC